MASGVAVEKAPDIQPECRHRWIIDGALRVDSNLGNTTESPASGSRRCGSSLVGCRASAAIGASRTARWRWFSPQNPSPPHDSSADRIGLSES